MPSLATALGRLVGSVARVATGGRELVVMQQPGRVRVGPLDAEFAGARVWVMIGPTEAVNSSRYHAVLSQIAQRGPANRVGLRPQPHRRIWEFDPHLPASTVLGDLDIEVTAVDAAMDHLIRQPVDQPIHAAHVGGYLALCFDHGVGDAHAFAEIAASLTGAQDPPESGFLPPQPTSTLHRPLSRIARRALTAGPAAITRDVAHELAIMRARRTSAPDGERASSPDPAGGDYSTVFLRSEPGYLAAVRALRDRRYPAATAASLIFYGIRSSLHLAGVQLSVTTSFLTDLRRYLRTGEGTLANLSTVAEAVTPDGQSFEDFAASLARATTTTYPATRTLAACAAWALRRPGRDGADGLAGDGDGKVSLTLSDVSRLPSLRKFRYRSGGDHPIVAVALPPGARNHLTIALTGVAGELQLTATFFPDTLDAAQLRAALERGLTLDALRTGSP